MNNDFLPDYKDIGNFEVAPFEEKLDGSYIKLDLEPDEKKNISAAMSQLPLIISSEAVSSMYYLSFPDGLPHTLMSLGQGGFSSTYYGADGLIAGTASLYPAANLALLTNIFSVMSIASSQYFLTAINNELKMLNYQIDKILAFLYGDKKAELLSELKFVLYAHKNYRSIMKHEQQRAATLASIQSARKVAMKDIEFYIQDLNSAVNSNHDLKEIVSNSIQIKDSLRLSLQLYTMCCVLEAHYSLNNDRIYIENVEEDIISYSDKCRDRIIDCFGNLAGRINNSGGGFMNLAKTENDELKEKVSAILNDMHNTEASLNRKNISEMLKSSKGSSEYVVASTGDVYYKKTV